MSRSNQVGSHKTSIFTDEFGYTNIVYHSTQVVRFNDKEIILNTGGFKTSTTKTRMNQASMQFRLGFRVYQRKYEWYIAYMGETYEYDTSKRMVLNREVLPSEIHY